MTCGQDSYKLPNKLLLLGMGRSAGSNENKALSFKLSLSLAIPAWKTILRIIIPECGHLGTQSSILKNSKHIFSAGAASNKLKMNIPET